MALYGAQFPCIASAAVTTVGEEQQIAYTDGTVLSQLASCEVTHNWVNGSYDADNEKQIYKQKYVDTDISIEVQRIDIEVEPILFGNTLSTTSGSAKELSRGSSDNIPQIGFGFINNEIVPNGSEIFTAHLFPWAQATPSTQTYTTRTSDSISFSGHPLTLKAYADPASGKYEYVEEFTTEAAAKAYLKTKLGIN